MSKFLTGPTLIFIAAVLWGVDGMLRRTLYTLPPITIVFWEHVVGLIVIAPLVWYAWQKEKERGLTKMEWGAITLVALFSGVLGTLFFTAALLKVQFITFSVVYLVQKLQPVFAVLMARVVLKERIAKGYTLWAGLALVAGYFVTFPGGVVDFSQGGAYVVAALYAFLAAVMWGSSTALSRYTLLKHSDVLVTGLRFLLAAPLALLLMFFMGQGGSLGAVTVSQIGALFLISVTTGAFALIIYYRGLKATSVQVSAIVELAFPLTAIFIDFFLYHTTLTAGQYAAGAVLLFAMYRVSLLNARRGTME
jgi:drug/metabolite transporter (DMT)-like permease